MRLYEYVLKAKDQFSDTFNKLISAAGGAEGGMSKLETAAGKATGAVGKTGGMIGNLRSEMVRLEAAKNRAWSEGQIESFNRRIRDTQKEIDRLEGRTDSWLTGLRGQLATAFAIGSILTFAGGIVKAGADMEQTRVKFQTFYKSVETGNQAVDQLNKFANVTPFTNAEVLKAGEGLAGYGVQVNDLIPTLQMLGDASGGNAQKMNELINVYGKAKSVGKVQGEIFNQFGERGINVAGEMAKMFGVSQEKVLEMGSKGQISFAHLQTALQRLTGEGGMFYKMMEKQSNTLAGKWSTLVGKIQGRMFQIGEAIQPMLKPFVDFGIAIVENQSLLEGLGATIGIAAGVIGLYKLGVMGAVLWNSILDLKMKALRLSSIFAAKGFAGLNAVMALNPVGLVVTAIGVLIGVLIYAYNKFDWFRGGVWGIWEVFKTAFSNISNFFKLTFAPITEAMTAFSNPDLSGWEKTKIIAKSLGQVALNLNPVAMIKNGIQEFSKTDYKGAWDKGYKEGVVKEGINPFKGLLGSDITGAADPNAPVVPVAPTSDDTKAGIDNITGGGSRAVSVTVNLEKFLDKIEVHSTSTKEGLDDIEPQIREFFVRVLNGGLYSATQ
jgi:tape measure domain-containing protein